MVAEVTALTQAPLPGGVCLPLDLACAATGAAADGFTQIANSAGAFAADMLARAATWWIDTPSVNPDGDAVRTAQSYTVPLIALILMASILAQSIRIIVQRKITPLLDAGMGLVRYAVTTGMGLLLLGAAVQAADAFSQWMLNDSIQQFSDAVGRSLSSSPVTAAAAATTGITNVFGLLILALVVLLLAAIQWVLGFLRQAGVLVLAAMLPLAAAGSASQTGKAWLSRLVSWLAALVAYKPMAALIYVIGFSLLGHADGVTTAITGIMVLLLALVALPAMMRFFSWAVPSGGGGGGVAGALGAFAGSRLAAGGGGGGGAPSGAAARDASVQQSGRMEATGPSPQPGGGPSGAQQDTSPPRRLPGRERGEASPQQAGTSGASGTSATGTASGGPGMAAGAAAGLGAAAATGVQHGAQGMATGMQGGGVDEQQRGQ